MEDAEQAFHRCFPFWSAKENPFISIRTIYYSSESLRIEIYLQTGKAAVKEGLEKYFKSTLQERERMRCWLAVRDQNCTITADVIPHPLYPRLTNSILEERLLFLSSLLRSSL